MKILIGTNTLTAIDHAVYSNHCQFWYRLGKHYPEWQFIVNHPRRQSIDNMRNMSAKVALESEADYLMFIDDDVIVPMDALDKLIKTGADIAAGHTIIRGYPFENMFFKYLDKERQNLAFYRDPVKNEKGLYECDAVGFSCVIIKVDLLRRMSPPYFITGVHNTEDVWFCVRAKEEFPETTIVVHPDVITPHCLGTEYIDALNRPNWKEFVEKMYPVLLTKDENSNRGDGYAKLVDPSFVEVSKSEDS